MVNRQNSSYPEDKKPATLERRTSFWHRQKGVTKNLGGNSFSSQLNYPRRESNPHLRFRKPPFYPLNYGDMSELRRQISDIRFQISIMPFKTDVALNDTCRKRRPARRPNSMMHCNARPVLRPAFSFYQTREESVVHADQVQSFGRRSKTDGAWFARLQSHDDILDIHFAKRAFHERADD